MRRIIFFVPIVFFVLISCSKKEVKFETFATEAFAYDLGNAWEVNATVNVRGFEQHENKDGENFSISLLYSVDLTTPEGRKIENLYSDNIDLSKHEKFTDIPVEAQFDLDSTYALGKYELIFNIKDNYSNEEISGKVPFDLNK